MKKKMLTLSICALLILTFLPVIESQEASQEILFSMVELNICRYEKDGSVERTVKQITSNESLELKNQLNQIRGSNLTIREKFEQTLILLKDFKLVSSDTTLEDLTGNWSNTNKFNNVSMQNFQAHFAPILVVGGGFGIGSGMPDLRVFNGFTHFIGLIGGLGFVLCVDFIEQTAYTLISYMFPILIGYMAGYMGLIIFAVYPGSFYSNLAMLGFVPYTLWIQIPNMGD